MQTETWLTTLRDRGRLPALPPALEQVLELTRHPNAQLSEVAALVATDLTLAARVMGFASAPSLGFTNRVTSVPHAVNLLGLDGVKAAATALCLAGAGPPATESLAVGFDLQRFWGRCIVTAVAAKTLSRDTGKAAAEEAFVAGLLARVGQLTLATGLPLEYAEVLRDAGQTATPLSELEQTRLGTTHRALGARLVEHWGLPSRFAAAIRGLGNDLGNAGAREREGALAHVLYVASLFGKLATDPEARTTPAIEGARRAATQHLGCTEAQWLALADRVGSEWREVLGVLNVEPAQARWFAGMQSELQHQVKTLAKQMRAQSPSNIAEQHDALVRSSTDRPTGFGNRAAFDLRLALELERARRSHAPLALLLVTLDDVRAHQDAWGPAAVDQLMMAVARAVNAAVRRVDYVARLNESELAVIAAECDDAGAAMLSERLRTCIPRATLEWRKVTLSLRASIGAASLRFPERPLDASALIAAADAKRILARRALRAGTPKAR